MVAGKPRSGAGFQRGKAHLNKHAKILKKSVANLSAFAYSLEKCAVWCAGKPCLPESAW